MLNTIRARTIQALASAAVLFAALGVRAEQVRLQAAISHPVLEAGEKHTAHLKVALTGFRFQREADRAPVNVALVIDTSGSMQGEKIVRAREAAILAIRSLGPRDIASVVEYDDQVRVMVPATRITDPESICAAIRRLEPGKGTALFAGVSKGAEEVRKFLDRSRVNRIASPRRPQAGRERRLARWITPGRAVGMSGTGDLTLSSSSGSVSPREQSWVLS